MDHFPIPPGAAHIKIPCISTERYDNEPFRGYPERTGWQEAHLKSGKFPGRESHEVEAFFQRWLFFGMLVNVFKIGGVSIDQQEFLEINHGKTWMTTKNLDEYIARWEKLWTGPANSISHRASWAKTKAILDEVIVYIEALGAIACPSAENPTESYSRNECLLSSAVSGDTLTAIVALAYTLSEVAIRVYRPEWNEYRKYFNYTTKLLSGRLEDNGWCRSDMRRMFTELGIDGHYYFALLQSPHEKGRHENCSELMCVAANNTDEAAYRTLHVDTCHGDDDMSADEISEITKKVVDIIEDGGVPVIAWEGNEAGGHKRALMVEDAVVKRLEYKAISHVWADGLGNPHGNSLPCCQLNRIQRSINYLPGGSDDTGPRWFWMDTICVPVGKQYKPLRKAAIAQMADIYQSSTGVLVLDAWVQTLSVETTILDKMARIYASNWVHRLWTVQESVLSENVYLQFADGQQLLDEIREPCQIYRQRNKEPKQWAAYIRSPGLMEGAGLGYMEALRGYVTKKYSPDRTVAKASLELAHLSRGLEQRSTTRPEDEPVCASTLLLLNTTALLAIDGPDVVERRMEEFWRQMRGVSKGIIFHHSPRLTKRGFRWAPRTLMGARPGDFWRDFDVGVSDFGGYGLTTHYPGILMETEVAPPSDCTLVVRLTGDASVCYSIRLHPEAGGYPEWAEPARCAVVMFRPISSDGRGTDAIVGIVEYGRPGRTISLLFQTRAVVEAVPRAEVKEDAHVFASRLADSQEWFVA